MGSLGLLGGSKRFVLGNSCQRLLKHGVLNNAGVIDIAMKEFSCIKLCNSEDGIEVLVARKGVMKVIGNKLSKNLF